jgi:hypothetical protein
MGFLWKKIALILGVFENENLFQFWKFCIHKKLWKIENQKSRKISNF